jgi:hypothetical protein
LSPIRSERAQSKSVEPSRTKNAGLLSQLSTIHSQLVWPFQPIPGYSRGYAPSALPTLDRGLWTVDCGLWTVDCGLWPDFSPIEPSRTKKLHRVELGTFPADRCYRIVIGRVLSFPIHRINGHLHF